MAFPTGWGRKCAVTISSTYVSGTSHTDFPVLITEDMLPSEMFDADGSYPALNGGGDIRFSSDSAGTTQLACEVVSFVTDNNPANGSTEIWVKVPTLSGSTDTTIYVWYNKAGESQPAVTDTYGRNAVWADYLLVHHAESEASPVDSTGNGYNGTPSNLSSVAGQFGGAWGFNGSSSYLDLGNASALSLLKSGDPDFSVSLWAKADAENSEILLQKDQEWGVQADDESLNGALSLRFNFFGSNNTSAVTDQISVGAWAHLSCVVDPGSGVTAYVDSATEGTYSTANVSTATSSELGVGAYKTGGSWTAFFAGEIDELRIRNSNLASYSAGWIATEYNNQSSPSTFASAGTPESVGGGATYTETLDGALTTGGNLVDTFTPGAVSYQEDFAGLLQTGGDLAPVITYALDAAGALQSGGDLADTFGAGAVTYTETLDGTLQSGGDLIPVVGYGLVLDGMIQSGGSLADTFTTPGSYSEAFSGALTTGGDLVPVLSSSIAAIGSLDTGGDLVVFVSYAQTIGGLLQTGGDLADTFADATGAWSEAMAGALTTGGDLVPVAQWGVLVDGALTVGGALADLFESGVVDEVDGLEIAREVAMTRSIYNALGQSVTYRGDAVVRIKAIFDQRDDLAGGFDARAVGGDAVARIQVADVASPERGDTITTRLGTVHTVDQYQRLNWAEWIVELRNNG